MDEEKVSVRRLTELHKTPRDSTNEGDSHCTVLLHDGEGPHLSTHALKDKKRVAAPGHRTKH